MGKPTSTHISGLLGPKRQSSPFGAMASSHTAMLGVSGRYGVRWALAPDRLTTV